MELISRQEGRMTAEEAVATLKANYPDACYEQLRKAVDTAIEALAKDTNVPTKWIPFKTRPLTEEEKEEYPEWDYILDCKLPNDGQRILVNIKYKSHEAVQMDEFYTDDGCYLDSGYEIGTEATAWMPLPEPYKDE